jgi:hypothetical protein
LLFQAAQHRAGEHNVADGRETKDEDLHKERKVAAYGTGMAFMVSPR